MTPSVKSIEERLNNHSELKNQILNLLDIIDNNTETVNEIEEKMILPVRTLGKQLIEEWAKGKEKEKSTEFKENNPKAKSEKKKFIGQGFTGK